MENLGYTGFLIQKTAQKNSIRADSSNFEEFKKRNIVAYIHKKVSNTRDRLGIGIRGGALSSGVTFVVRNNNIQDNEHTVKLNLPREKQELEKDIEEFEGDKYDDNYHDDFFVETKGGTDPHKKNINKKDRVDIHQKLTTVMNQKLKEDQLVELYTEYKRTQLKEKITGLKANQKIDFAKIQKKLANENEKTEEDEEKNQDQIEYFISQITKPSEKNPEGITIGQILNINDNQIEYKSKELEEEEREQKRQGRLAMEQLNDLIRDEEERQKLGIIRIYKETQLDNMDGDAAKHKFKMVNFKKKQEIQEKLFQEMASQEKHFYHEASKEKETVDPTRFVRPRSSRYSGPTKHLDVYDRLTRPSSLTDVHFRSNTASNLISITQPQSTPTKKITLASSQLRDEVLMLTKNAKSARPNTSYSHPVQDSLQKQKQNPLFGSFQSRITSPLSTTRQSHSQYYPQSLQTTRPNSSKPHRLLTASASLDVLHLQDKQKIQVKSQVPQHLKNEQVNQAQGITKIMSERLPSGNKSKEPMEWTISELKEKVSSLKGNNRYKKDLKKFEGILKKRELTNQIENLLSDCKTYGVESKSDSLKVKQKFQTMEGVINREIEKVEKTDFDKPIHNGDQNNAASSGAAANNKNEKFAQFKIQRNFKRKLVTFLLDKVEKQSDLISKYNAKRWTEDMLSQIDQQQQYQLQLKSQQSQQLIQVREESSLE